jgi:hypothetical protein
MPLKSFDCAIRVGNAVVVIVVHAPVSPQPKHEGDICTRHDAVFGVATKSVDRHSASQIAGYLALVRIRTRHGLIDRVQMEQVAAATGAPLMRGLPHSSLVPGLPECNEGGVPPSGHGHELPAGYHVVKTFVLGGVQHGYRLRRTA